jgi:cell division cycle 20-like protein 1 (cofactor of APC complex)
MESILKFTDHIAAIKIIACSPHQLGFLLSGSGTAYRTIKTRNTYTHRLNSLIA